MMRRFLAPAFVTVVACGKTTTPKPEVEAHNPPALEDYVPDAAPLGITTASATASAATTADASTSAAPTATARVRGVHKKRKRTAKANFERKEGATLGESSSTLNTTDDKGRMIHVASDDTCFVEVPFAGPTSPTGGPSGITPRDQEEVDCPAALDDPAWDHCGDRLVIDPQSRCFCVASFGNPPPPPRLVKCPAGAKPATPKKR